MLSLLHYAMSGDVLTALLEHSMPCLQSPGLATPLSNNWALFILLRPHDQDSLGY